ncbi:unnamed protein product [Caenorhabditis angaria]|uniref:Uncharacterized protein n=1 Tax=Caenorhabditis angaria TaxID=860376 RepID=A0A9P1J2L4_9PELO|nr:unnamed protein product [Caenorhabditis angaria]
MNCSIKIVSILLIINIIFPVVICDNSWGASDVTSTTANVLMSTTTKPHRSWPIYTCWGWIGRRRCGFRPYPRYRSSSTLSDYLPSVLIFGFLYLLS